MPYIEYVPKRFADSSLKVISQANEILERFGAQGFKLTLRQLYYQFVAAALIPNTMKSYKRLGAIVSDARRAGLIDWDAIEDRTRSLRQYNGWSTPQEFITEMSRKFLRDLWEDQPAYVEVWFEKEALLGVFERAVGPYRLPHFPCKGYPSDSEVWAAAQRLMSVGKDQIVILHFGDHDPSGVDMTRDVEDRLRLFSEGIPNIEVRRIALTMEQIRRYNPPPNPAKMSDSRFYGYEKLYGQQSWELDALTPTVLADLVRREVTDVLDTEAWNRVYQEETEEREVMARIATRWSRVRDLLKEAS